MLSSAQQLTASATVVTCDPSLSFTARTLLSSSFMFLQVSGDTKNTERMEASKGQSSRPPRDGQELWFSTPSSRCHHDLSAYQAIAIQQHAATSTSTDHVSAPLVSGDSERPPPPGSSRNRPKTGLLDLLKKKSSENLHSPDLQPISVNTHQQSTSKENLSPGRYLNPVQSRSMPNSPLRFSPPQPLDMQRSRSATTSYAESTQYQAYQPRPQVPDAQSASSMNTYIDPTPAHTARRISHFPETGTSSSATARESVSDVPRPHTWVSSSETFGADTDFHLFAEATAGLRDGFDPLSPSDTPRLHGSLFARVSQNDRIPLLERAQTTTHSVPVTEVPSYDWMPAQAPREYYSVSRSALPRHESYDVDLVPSLQIPNLNDVNLELERLGLADDEHPPDDELPNYAQSQAEMAAIKRQEASARARELESRWNLSRSWRGR